MCHSATFDTTFSSTSTMLHTQLWFWGVRPKKPTFDTVSECKNRNFLENSKMTKILIVEQSKSVRNNLRERLEFEGFQTEGAESAAIARRMWERLPVDVVLADSVEGLEGVELPLIILSRDSSIASAVEAVRHGAVDFLTKPIDMNRLLGSIRRAIAKPSKEEVKPQRTTKPRNSAGCATIEPIVGESDAIVRVRELVDKVARSEARVLITGENGTGKELVARWLHCKSSRSDAPFVEVNCAAIPSELIESELFGHE